jgi:CRP-like cAMP-binding protein
MFMLGMAMVALADVFDVRLVFFAQALAFLFIGSLALVLPGLGQPAAQWRRAISLLRGAKAAPGLSPIRPMAPADMDLLVARLPALGGLSETMRKAMLSHAAVTDAPAGVTILRKGDRSDAAYFVLAGRAVAGLDEQGGYRVLEVLNAGDFFGEIAALTGTPRTANVVAEQPATLVQVPAATLRQMMADGSLRRLFMSKMTERMVRMRMIDLPRLGGLDQETLRDLRTPEPEPQPQSQATP